MKKLFKFEDYKGNYVMHCKTEEEAIEFCKVLHEDGRTWANGESYAGNTYWKWGSTEGLFYEFNTGEYGRTDYFEERSDYTILEWEDFTIISRETIVYKLSGYDVETALEEMRIEYTEEQLHNIINYIHEHNLSIPYGEYMTPMIEMAIEEGVFGSVPFEPKEGDGYYYPNIGYTIQVGCKNWCNSPTDIRIKKYVGCYRTKEEAIAKAKELWGKED